MILDEISSKWEFLLEIPGPRIFPQSSQVTIVFSDRVVLCSLQ